MSMKYSDHSSRDLLKEKVSKQKKSFVSCCLCNLWSEVHEGMKSITEI